MLFGVGVLDGQGSPAPNGLPRSVKLSVVVLPGRSTLDTTSMPPPQPTVLAAVELADDVVAAATVAYPPPYGARILGLLYTDEHTPRVCPVQFISTECRNERGRSSSDREISRIYTAELKTGVSRWPLLHVSLSTIRRAHVLDAFVYQFGHHLSHRPLHTRSPRGNTVSDQRVRRLTRSLFNTVSTPPNERRYETSPRQGPRSSARWMASTRMRLRFSPIRLRSARSRKSIAVACIPTLAFVANLIAPPYTNATPSARSRTSSATIWFLHASCHDYLVDETYRARLDVYTGSVPAGRRRR
ncbi:hypothetical protein ALC53_08885 [Atta colombica]|uniref:Uncharacterized protein n=1 Tax=Atta colombica TaxID=520822 RepID=A0A195B885_9HYME|nr:hypothetical protein ALC53_08885 [Atta colombica]